MSLPRIFKQPFPPFSRGQVQLYDEFTQWLGTELGQSFLSAQQSAIDEVLPSLFGYHILQHSFGQQDFLGESRIRHKVAIQSAVAGLDSVDAVTEALPFAADSLDVVLLHHSLDLAAQPHDVLREASRVLIPGGHLVVVGFHPVSLWGLVRVGAWMSGKAPWSSRFIHPHRVNDWMQLLGFDICQIDSGFYSLPVRSAQRQRMVWLNNLGVRFWPQHGAFYVMVATKRVSCVTPIVTRARVRKPALAPVAVARRETK